MATTPRFNKSTGLYGMGRGRRRGASRSGNFLSGITDIFKRSASKKRAQKRKKEDKQLTKTFKRNLMDAGMRRRDAKSTAIDAVKDQRSQELQAKLAANRAKRAAKASSRAAQASVNESQTQKSTGLPGMTSTPPVVRESSTAKKDNVYEYTDRSGRTTSYDPTKKAANKNANIATDYTRINRGGVMGKTSLQQQKNKYQERAKGNVKSMVAAKKAGKETFQYINPRTGEKRTIKVSNYKMGK